MKRLFVVAVGAMVFLGIATGASAIENGPTVSITTYFPLSAKVFYSVYSGSDDVNGAVELDVDYARKLVWDIGLSFPVESINEHGFYLGQVSWNLRPRVPATLGPWPLIIERQPSRVDLRGWRAGYEFRDQLGLLLRLGFITADVEWYETTTGTGRQLYRKEKDTIGWEFSGGISPPKADGLSFLVLMQNMPAATVLLVGVGVSF